MKPCWPEGELRAYADGELPLEAQERIGEHLEECAECAALYGELSARAARVSNLLAALPEMATTGALPALPARTRQSRPWAVAALALAAALALCFMVLPKRGRQPAVVAKAPAVAPAAERPAVRTPAVLTHPVPRRVAHAKPVRREDYFLRLDDDPIETGTLVRVSAENGDVQADLIIGPDGRAHAIRVVGNQ
jgi:anti-sigma factor RsiW